MANVNWNRTNLATLRSYCRKGLFEEAAAALNCSVNAVRVKYNRIKELPPEKTSKNEANQKSGEKNPFEITQEEFTGARTTPDVVLSLVKQMLKIKPNKLDCIIVPLSVADSKKRASNIFQQAKNYLARTDRAEMVFTIKSTFSGDKNKSYLGGRIWRIK